MSPAHEKAAGIAVGLASGFSGVVLSILSGLQTFGAILGILSVMVGLGGGLLALYVRKLIRDREDERSKDSRRDEQRMDERFNALNLRIEKLATDGERTRAMIDKAILQYENLSKAVARNEGQISEIRQSLSRGNERFARLEGKLSAAGNRRGFRREDSGDGE